MKDYSLNKGLMSGVLLPWKAIHSSNYVQSWPCAACRIFALAHLLFTLASLISCWYLYWLFHTNMVGILHVCQFDMGCFNSNLKMIGTNWRSYVNQSSRKALHHKCESPWWNTRRWSRLSSWKARRQNSTLTRAT